MKKKVLAVLLVIATIIMTGCSSKEPLSPESFKTKMEGKGYTIIDKTSEINGLNQTIETCYIALNEMQTYQIEYYSFDGEPSAQTFYTQNKQILGGSGSHTEINLGSSAKYTQTYNNKYSVISRVNNTAIYLSVDKSYEEEIKTLLKDIGY